MLRRIGFGIGALLLFACLGWSAQIEKNDDTDRIKSEWRWEQSAQKVEELEKTVETLEKEVDKNTQVADATKDRVSDIATQIDQFGILVTVFGILMTGIVIFFSIRSTREAKLEARDEAETKLRTWLKQDATTYIQNHVEDKAQDAFKKANQDFETKVAEMIDKLQARGDEILRQIEEKATQQYQRHEEDHKKLMLGDQISDEEQEKYKREAKIAEEKPEKDLTFDDYWIRIVIRYIEKDYPEVLALIEKAMNLSTTTLPQAALLLMAKGNTEEKEDPKAAIATYAELIGKFWKSTNEEAQLQVVIALYNKGVLEGTIDPTIAIATYTELIERFGESANEEIRVRVAKALFNKGVTEGQEDPKASIATYAELIGKFGESANEEIRVQVAKALVNKGITEGQEDPKAAIATYAELIGKFGESGNEEIRGAVADAITNKLELQIVSGETVDSIDESGLDEEDRAVVGMLQLLNDAKWQPQDEAMSRWQERYANIRKKSWTFDEMEGWAQKGDFSPETKERLRSYIDTFKNHLHQA